VPRRPRIHQPDGFYHVTLRGNHQQDIFRNDTDRRLLSAIVARSTSTYGARVHAYCWMSNHLHLLVQIGSEPLGSVVRQIASEYARAYQRRLQTTGHLFERRHHASLVRDDRYLLTLLRYIHLNPVEAGIVRNAGEYRWSSHGAYAGECTETWLTTEFLLAMFAHDRPAAITAYLRFMQTSIDGAEALSDAIATNASSLDSLIAEACTRFHTSLVELQAECRDVRLMQVRAWISLQAITLGIATMSELARALGRDRATLRNSMRRYLNDRGTGVIPTICSGT
jgi:putative transposase